MSHDDLSQSDEVLRRAAAGDPEARAELLGRYRPRLLRMVVMRLDKRLSRRFDASDVVQEALVVAQARFDEYFQDPQISFYPWLRRIAWDRLVDHYRRHVTAQKRSVLREYPWTPNLNNESVCDLAKSLVQSSVNPTRRMMMAEMQTRVAEALKSLKPHDREILVLRHLEQLQVPEIAEVLGISHTNVTTRHLRALQRLRRRLGDQWGA